MGSGFPQSAALTLCTQADVHVEASGRREGEYLCSQRLAGETKRLSQYKGKHEVSVHL